jgi:hypothetical protein
MWQRKASTAYRRAQAALSCGCAPLALARCAAQARAFVVEREFGRLKHEWALAPLRVRGLDRVRLHADLAILAKLSGALAGARAVPLAA